MEGKTGRFRRRHLVPLPVAAPLAAVNDLIAAADIADDGRVITVASDDRRGVRRRVRDI